MRCIPGSRIAVRTLSMSAPHPVVVPSWYYVRGNANQGVSQCYLHRSWKLVPNAQGLVLHFWGTTTSHLQS